MCGLIFKRYSLIKHHVVCKLYIQYMTPEISNCARPAPRIFGDFVGIVFEKNYPINSRDQQLCVTRSEDSSMILARNLLFHNNNTVFVPAFLHYMDFSRNYVLFNDLINGSMEILLCMNNLFLCGRVLNNCNHECFLMDWFWLYSLVKVL